MMTDHDPTAQRIDDLLDAIAERDRRIRAQAEQINELKAMLAMTRRTP